MIRDDFPALAQTVHGRRVAWLDSAASAQKPVAVMDAMRHVMETHYANVHRGVYDFGARTSAAFESARATVAAFLGADSAEEIVFTRNATEAINLVASGLAAGLRVGDEILLTELEHHANIVPWYMAAQKSGAVLRAVPVLENGALDMDAFDRLLTEKTKIFAVTQMSNALGTVPDVGLMVQKAKAMGAVTLVDGSQGVVHGLPRAGDIGCDFYAMTGHKLYGPTGIGVLYGRMAALESLPPYQGGGEMIDSVAFDRVTYKAPPHRFEAGTPPIVQAIGLAAAMDYVRALPADALVQEAMLLHAAEARIADIGGVRVYSRAPDRAAILSFTVDDVHPHDIATIFDQVGLAVRAGHHCCQPLMRRLGVTATVRASFAVYNTMEDVDRLAEGLVKVKKIFG